MDVGSVTSIPGTTGSSPLDLISNQATAGGNAAGFGPAFVVGGSKPDFAAGLYNSLGNLLGADAVASPPPDSKPLSAAEKERAARLASAAGKIDAGDNAGAREDANAVLERNPSDTGALNLLAQSHVGDRNYKQAEQVYARAAALNPDNVVLQTGLANARSLQKSDADVLAEASRKISSPSHRTESFGLLLRLIERSPDNTDAYLALSDGFRDARRPAQAMSALRKALDTADGKAVDEIITRARQLVERNPEDGVSRDILGRALEKAGRVDEAVKELQTATHAAPNNVSFVFDLADARVARALIKLDQNNVDSATTDLQAAQSIDPANPGLGEALARVAGRRAGQDITAGLFNRALGELSTATSKAPDDARFKKTLAGLYGQVAGHFERQNADSVALASYRKANELDPESGFFQRKVGELSHTEGLDAISRQDYDAAVSHLDRAFQANTNNPLYRQDLARAFDLRGQRQLSLNKTDEALADFKKAFSLDPSNASIDADLSSALA